jgi:RNA polymerase sigma factor (sigma-70 family)
MDRKHAGWESRPYQVDPAQHLGLVALIARKFPNMPGLDLEERVAIGTMGLIKAAKIFEPERGLKFSTMAGNWIFSAIQREYERVGFVGRHSASRVGTVRFKDAGHIPEPEAPGELDRIDAAIDVEDIFARHGKRLRSTHRRVLQMRASGISHRAIGKRLGVSGSRAQQVEAEALEILRSSIKKRAMAV